MPVPSESSVLEAEAELSLVFDELAWVSSVLVTSVAVRLGRQGRLERGGSASEARCGFP